MRSLVAIGVATACLGGAREARKLASQLRTEAAGSQPYAPSTAAAPYVSLGYREAAADVLFVRLRGYFGDYKNAAEDIAGLCEAIVALDHHFERVYEYCGHAMTLAKAGVNQRIYLRAIGVLERGARAFPTNWRIPNLAGQIYTQDLHTDDPAQRREWDEKGTLLVESAIRKPGAPAELENWAAVMRTKFGQRERAIEGLREVLLLTSDTRAQRALLDRLAKLEAQDADEIAQELYEARRKFEVQWQNERPSIPATWYVLLGPRVARGFNLTDLATGGRDLVIAEPILKSLD